MKIAVCAICRNEILYLKEWLSFYKLVGFDDVYVCDNVSDDGTSELLLALHSTGDVKRVFWPRVDNVPPQRSAYAHFINNYAVDYDFVLICDLDELLIVPNYNVKSFLKNALADNPNLGAIAIPWLMFGSGGEEQYRNELMIDRFTMCDNKVSTTVKTLFRTSCVQNMRTHICDLISGDYLNGHLSRAVWHDINPHWVINNNENGAVIYHYYTKSKEEWIKRRTLPKADRAGIEKRRSDDFNLYAHQTRVNLKAKALSAGVTSTIQSIDDSLLSLNSQVNQLNVNLVDVKNDWIFGVVKGAFEGVIVINVIINAMAEIKINVRSSGDSITPFIYKSKWFVPNIEFLAINIVGVEKWEIFKQNQLPKNNDRFMLICKHFPQAEEHIFSIFLSTLRHNLDPVVSLKTQCLVFHKYPLHKVFIDSILSFFNSGSIVEMSEFIQLHPEYKKFIFKTKNALLLSYFEEGLS